ncbi:ribosomal RNA small subunit methyltransferase A [candidate division WWE3 bacterium CG_4_9_14_3_um_filter_34_6]|uniref:Ribosomal RNA small subunit methyltransferase A n=1 Tax=candidate division WWE3 bacterium CG_4_9_14_3_um_filter_34_6 TaxID=1975079 RepID=A0A2M7X3A6_UNCKA|nr:MAG: ribosomal RNA small subunit methyltransferase A [candidate division WWE3 bacterium CG_4_9_14_3_um_filter_34_6]
MYNKKKSLGQNFLNDESVADKMIVGLNLKKEETILEIGGGAGAITQKLIKLSSIYEKLDVYELDNNWANVLKILTKSERNCEIINSNFLDADLSKYVGDWKVIGSIPYYITSPIIHKLLELKNRPKIIVLMIQKEVADKILNTKPKSSYWSNIILGYRVEKIVDIPKTSFNPVPKVDSCAIKLLRNEEDEMKLNKIGFVRWSKFLHHAYKNPRKMLNKTFDKELLAKICISSTLRPQNLDSSDWIKIYESVSIK